MPLLLLLALAAINSVAIALSGIILGAVVPTAIGHADLGSDSAQNPTTIHLGPLLIHTSINGVAIARLGVDPTAAMVRITICARHGHANLRSHGVQDSTTIRVAALLLTATDISSVTIARLAGVLGAVVSVAIGGRHGHANLGGHRAQNPGVLV